MHISGSFAAQGRNPVKTTLHNSPLSDKEIRFCLVLLALPIQLIVLGLMVSALSDKSQYSPKFEPRPTIEKSAHATAKEETRGAVSYGSMNSPLLKFMLLALSAAKALGSDVCDSATKSNLELGMNTRIGSCSDLLLAQPNLYITYINTTDQSLRGSLFGLRTMMDACLSTPSGASQFSDLQLCSGDLFSTARDFSSPLIALNGTLHGAFNGNYNSEAGLSWDLVPYTRAAFLPLTGDNGFFQESADIWATACGRPPYDTTTSNQTNAAIVARDSFLESVHDGFSPINTIFRNENLGLSASFVSDLGSCRQGVTSTAILNCLTTESAVLTSESNRLYAISSNLLSGVDSLETTTHVLNQFSSSALISYGDICSESQNLYQSAIDCGWVPPTDNPSAMPTPLPTSSPSVVSTFGPTASVNKESCPNEGIPTWIFGVALAGVGTLFGCAGYYFGGKHKEKSIENAAIQKAARENSLEAPGIPGQEAQTLETQFAGVLALLRPYAPWLRVQTVVDQDTQI